MLFQHHRSHSTLKSDDEAESSTLPGKTNNSASADLAGMSKDGVPSLRLDSSAFDPGLTRSAFMELLEYPVAAPLDRKLLAGVLSDEAEGAGSRQRRPDATAPDESSARALAVEDYDADTGQGKAKIHTYSSKI